MRINLLLFSILAFISTLSAQQKPPSTEHVHSKQLRALKEPFLGKLPCENGGQTYRFVWLRTFHHPTVIRVEISADGTGLIRTKVSSGQGGYEPGHLIRDDVRKLTKRESQWFLDRLQETDFWNVPSDEREDEIVLDGATWIFEGIKGDNYHVVERYAPNCTNKVRGLGLLMLLEMGRLKLLYQEVY
jgi:hypothetical protein